MDSRRPLPVLTASVLLAVLSATATAGELPVKTRILPNGCRLAVVENHQAPVVALRVYILNTGSLYEGEWLGCGISHYCEHLVSGGTTATRTEAESSRLLQAIGGSTNAYTTRDLTCYHGQTHRDSFDVILDLFSDFVRNCALDPAEVKRERGVIQMEMLKDVDEPSRVAYQLLMETMYLEHPVRHPTIGYIDCFSALDREDVVRFVRERYAPNNTLVVVGGDVDPDVILDKLEAAFGDWKRSPQVDLVGDLPEEPRQLGRRFAEAEMDVREAIVRFGFHTIELSHPDLYALDMLAAVLGTGRTSRLHRRVVEKDRLTDGVQVGSYTPHYGAGVFHVIVSAAPTVVPALEAALFEEIARLAKDPPTADELRRAKVLVERNHVMSQLKAEDQAASVAIDLIGTGDPNFSAHYVERIQAVTGEQVSAMARKYFARENETLIVVKPRGTPPIFGAKEGGEILATCPMHPQVRRPGGGACPICGMRLVAPGTTPAGTTRKLVLDNGLTVLLQHNPATPTVAIQSYFRAGVLWETDANSGISNLMARLMLRGTTTRSVARIHEEMEDLGARMEAVSGNNTFGMSMDLLVRDLPGGLALYADVLQNAIFPESEVERGRQISRILIERQSGNWETEASRNFREGMFASHPYRRDRLGSLNSIGRIDRAAVVAHHAAYCSPGNGVLAVFGAIDLAAAESLVREAFGDWAPSPKVARDVPREPPLTASRVMTRSTDKGQVVISLGFPGATLDHPDRHVLQVIDAGTSGLGLPGGWLHHALRGEKDLVYYVHATNWNGFGAGAFYVTCPCRPDRYDEVIGIIRREIARVVRDGFTPEELENARRMCVTVDQISRQTNAERAQAAVLDELYGFGWDASKSYAETIAKITNEDVKRVAASHFEDSVLVLTAPEAWLKQRGYLESEEVLPRVPRELR